MSVQLLDTNVLVALFWANHEQHEPAVKWFAAHQAQGWATCPMTQAGFVRVSSNPKVFPDAPSPVKALKLLESNLRHPNHDFWKDDLSFSQATVSLLARFTGHQQTTDAYLLGLAIHRGGVLVTFDDGIAALVEPRSPAAKALEIIPT